MALLFGHTCTRTSFRHDEEMVDLVSQFPNLPSSQRTQMAGPATPSSEAIQSSPAQKLASQVLIPENAQGSLKPSESHRNESSMASESQPVSTPPQMVAAISPGSESQGMRRKAIQDELETSRAKRIRLHFDDFDSNSLAKLEKKGEILQRRGIVTIDLTGDLDNTTIVNIPSSELCNHDQNLPESDRSEADSSLSSYAEQERQQDAHGSHSENIPKTLPFSAWRDEVGDEIGWDSDDQSHQFGDWTATQYENGYDLGDNIFYDADDRVHRCRFCSHEFWSRYVGFCTHCEKGQTGIPYLEIIKPGASREADIEFATSKDIDEDSDLREVTGDFLDDGSSAYDTQDEQGSDFTEEYEINSMIDDEIRDSGEEEGSDNDEADYKFLYEQLLVENNKLLDRCFDLKDFKRDVLGSEYESDADRSGMVEDDSDFDILDDIEIEMGDEGIFMVDVATPEAVLIEVVLSQSSEELEENVPAIIEAPESLDNPLGVLQSQINGQSQTSEVTEDRLHARVEAYDVVRNGRDWNEVLLMSVDNNHTHEEVEL
jgi:hypothetical protein